MKIRDFLTAVSVGTLLACSPAMAQTAPAAAAPPSAQAFARAPALASVTISPDGKHMAALTSPDGEKVYISIWRTDALDQAPYVIASHDRLRFLNVRFVKNDRILISTVQTWTGRVSWGSGTFNGHIGKLLVADLQGKVVPILEGDRARSESAQIQRDLNSLNLLSALPKDPQNILALDDAGDVYKVNVYTGKEERIERGSDRYSGLQVDLDGAIRARQQFDYDNGQVYIAQWIKHPDTGAWEEHFRWYAKDREPMSIVGFTSDPNLVFVATNRGRDKTAIYEYSIRDRKLLEPAFEHKLFDAARVIQSSAAQDSGRVLGFVYEGERQQAHWTDEKLGSIAAGLRAALGVKTSTVDWADIASGQKVKFRVGDGADAGISDYSADLRYVVVEKSGPKAPPEYYLLIDGTKLQPLGRSLPDIHAEALGDTRLIEYAARDGLMIPAFLTTPPKAVYGPGPYPAIVLPHGGPWARDNLDWDVSGWTQYFAARGYAVLQPQFRGSQGWGQKLWRAGDREWGQKMQDDNDDGAKWMIAQGVAAPDRIAMHGYSYGGYAAMAASVRPNGLYQCAIAGAGLSTIDSFKKETFQSRFLREFQNPTADGLDPLDHAGEVSIPVFLYHGDRDTNVEIKESERYAAALKSAGKSVKFMELKDMGHGYVTWTPEHTAEVLTAVESFLKNDCGPGGL